MALPEAAQEMLDAKLEPMNSYQRRLVHHHFKDHPEVCTWSPEDAARLKRISISPRNRL